MRTAVDPKRLSEVIVIVIRAIGVRARCLAISAMTRWGKGSLNNHEQNKRSGWWHSAIFTRNDPFRNRLPLFGSSKALRKPVVSGERGTIEGGRTKRPRTYRPSRARITGAIRQAANTPVPASISACHANWNPIKPTRAHRRRRRGLYQFIDQTWLAP